MRENLLSVLKYFFLWLLFFCVERMIFLLFFVDKIKNFSSGEIAASLRYGLWMDISMSGYFSVLPLIGFLLLWLISKIRLSHVWFRIYFRTLVVLASLITVINFNIYREWGSKINSRAFEFLFASPGEAIASSVSSPLLLSFIILGLLILLGYYLSKQADFEVSKEGKWYIKLPIAILLLGLNFLAIRGGWQLAPMNESMAYYSAKPILNHAAVNTEWALLHSLMSKSSKKNPFMFYKSEEAESIVRELYPPNSGNTTRILTTDRPNIVLVIMESFTADVIESLDGEKGLDPGIESLLPEGILFKHIYASGDRTDKGVVSVLSAFPTQGMKSIMKENEKQSKLPSLFKALGAAGYSSSFYYGGEIQFANMKSYLLNTGCQELIDKTSFDKKDMNSKWGAYDDVVYRRLSNDLNKKKGKPFFSALLTLTNHEPFELPVKPHFPGEEIENKFRSTAYYSDSCLTAFIKSAKGSPWYKKTLFIVVADHGHRLPKNQHEIYDPKRYRIPLLLFGDAIRKEYRGSTVEKVGSQTDIAAILLAQLNLKNKDFQWSKDLYNDKVQGHAFYSWENSFGFVNGENKALTFDNTSKAVIYKSPYLGDQENSSLRYAKAYMQSVFQQFLSF
ncbi:LTA synthase family protein [Desertivirga arenae]|uniref:LTA synthase family protein n=1 Tax=Desertivirga arenae TaxID=2810309 RepID=UPI001A95E778|nr:alkaline phosphatase family protein [Pedobacter sp. SYSU D00823]